MAIIVLILSFVYFFTLLIAGAFVVFSLLFDDEIYVGFEIKTKKDFKKLFLQTLFWPIFLVKLIYDKWKSLPDGDKK